MTLNELIGILREAKTKEDIDRHRDQIIELIPQLAVMVGFDQQNHAHQYDLWEHSVHTVLGIPDDVNDNMLYLAALLHDIGKPNCHVYGEKDGHVNMHYYGHPLRSMEITRDEIIPGLVEKGWNLSEDDIRRLLYYVQYHDDRVSLRSKHLRRHLKLGVSLPEFQNLMKLQVADAKAHILLPVIAQRIDICQQLAGEYSQRNYEEIMNGKTKA